MIDEYDVPLEKAYVNGFYDEMVGFIRRLFSTTLEDNKYVKFAVITGCLRISKESIFTGLNNLKVLSILNERCSKAFGFTEDEVKQILVTYNLIGDIDKYKEWYDGYKFGSTEIYNPWDIISCVRAQIDHEETPFSYYWINSSGNIIIRDLLKMASDTEKKEIEELLQGKSIVKTLHEDITYEEVYNSMNNLWNFLFFTGYLRKEKIISDEVIALSIPNKEIRKAYEDKIIEWMRHEIERSNKLDIIYEALFNKDVKTVTRELNNVLLKTISFHDASENFYHGFMAGILQDIKDYSVTSNRETGNGRNDIMIVPTELNKKAVILEFKVAESRTGLENKAKKALKQIEDRQYSAELEDEKPIEIIKYGISFYRKECYIVAK